MATIILLRLLFSSQASGTHNHQLVETESSSFNRNYKNRFAVIRQAIHFELLIEWNSFSHLLLIKYKHSLSISLRSDEESQVHSS